MRQTITLLALLIFFIIDLSAQSEGKESEQDVMITQVENPASFPGGIDSLKSFIRKNLIQPKDKKSGSVYVAFMINKDGTTSDFEILKGLTKECDENAIEVLRKMPKWIPGTQQGKPIRQRFVMPVKFE